MHLVNYLLVVHRPWVKPMTRVGLIHGEEHEHRQQWAGDVELG